VALTGILRRRGTPRVEAEALYRAIVAQARAPAFYRDLGVPDTLDGRFDMVALHAFLVLHRLKAEGAAAAELAQAVFDAMFADMDASLREIGTGDLSVGRKVKEMARALNGRAQAYETGLADHAQTLQTALARNLYRKAEPQPAQLAAMDAYLRREVQALAVQSLAALAAGRVAFGPPPAP
jgi:cytochrome b pre-mRNA-processing protein 3